MNTPRKHLAISALAVLLICTPGRSSRSQDFGSVPEQRPRSRALSRMLQSGSQELELIIRLASPSVLEWLHSGTGRLPQSTGAARNNLQVASTAYYRAQAGKERQQLVRALESIGGVRVEAQTETVLHAIIARVPADKYSQVLNLPGVKKVYVSRRHRMLLDAAAVQVAAQGLWNIAGGKAKAGRGVKIGIIDSGIDITHPMFIDNTLTAPAGYPKGDLSFTNSKVIVARNYVSGQRETSPIDEKGHGTFVAGIAAGKEVVAPQGTISGMAPGAFLGNYKVFGTPGVNDTASTGSIIAAIDDAVEDGMDVLNLSLGSLDYVPPSEDPEQDAIRNAVAAGVVITVSAGNEGPETYTISSPGTAPDAITVGSVSNSRMLASPLRVTSPVPIPSDIALLAYRPGDGPQVTANLSSTPIVDVAVLDGDGYGCSALASGSLASKIALVQRGGAGTACFFVTKVNNAAAAGATAVVVYNNVAPGVINMGGLGETTIPAVMISRTDGLALKDFIASHTGDVQVAIDASTTLVSVPATARVLSPFGSVGPGMDFSIKPDLVAVGENVYSATQTTFPSGDLYDATGFTSAQGTSFSAPMVAGAAAAVRQLFPRLGPLAIKSILTSTASRELTSDGSNEAGILHAGSGLLNMAAAATAAASVLPSALNFGTQAYDGSLTLARSLNITNIASSTDQFSLSVEPIASGASITLSRSDTGAMAPNGSTSVDVVLRVSSGASGGFQGFVSIRSSRTGSVYRIPYWAGLYTPDPSRILTITKGPGLPGAYGNVVDALRDARPGNVVEIADSGTYPAGVLVTTNGEGLPLSGVSIRAKAGYSPVLDGGDADAVFQLIGVRDFSLRGVTLSGGGTGVLLLQPSPTFPVSVTVDRCTINNPTDSSGAAIVAEEGGTVNVTHSILAGSRGSGILADRAFVTVVGGRIEQNASDGVNAYGSNVQILRATVAGNTGAGLYLDTCSGTIEGNSFSQNRGSYGDGFYVTDSTLTVANNTFDSNERAGMAFVDYAGGKVKATGNRSRANEYGLLASPATGLTMDGNLIADNSRGVRLNSRSTASLVNNIVARSASGNGVEVAGGSSVRIVNNTIFGNSDHGINASTGSVTVVNSIIASNRGDLYLVPQDSVRSSLVGDGTFASVNNNLSGDPRFVDAASGDFRPAAGSPVVDAGSNEAADLTFLDSNGQLRVSSFASALPGDGKVDIGAVEANSAYPLIYPVVANGTQAALGDTVYAGYAAVNNGSSPTGVRFAAFDASGAMLAGTTNPALQPIDPAHQIAPLGFQLFGYDPAANTLGSVLADSVQPVSGFFLLFDHGFRKFSIGANATADTATELYFARHLFDASGNATYALFNPGVNAATVNAQLMSVDGSPVGNPAIATVAAKGQYVFSFENVTSPDGYVRVQSDRPVAGLEIFGRSPILSVLNANPAGTEARLFFPHVAVNGGFTSLIGIVNGSTLRANVSLTAYDSNGHLLGVPRSVELSRDAQLLESVETFFGIPAGPLTTGYIVAESDQPGINGFTQFVFDDGRNRSATAVPADSVPRQHLVFSHVAHQVPAGSGGIYLTGVGLLNPFGTAIDFTMRVFNRDGVKVAEKSGMLRPHEKVAKMLSHPVADAGFFSQELPLSGGHIEVDSDYGLLGFELFFTESFSQLASVPPQN